MADRWENRDTADYRTLPPGQNRPCEVLVWVDGSQVWCRGTIEVWQRRRGFHRVGPDGWWGYGEWYLPNGQRAGGWAHESELRPRATPQPKVANHPRVDPRTPEPQSRQ